MDFIKIKNFRSVKGLDKKRKRQTIEWAKIFAHHISDKGLVSRIQKELSKINSKVQLAHGPKTLTPRKGRRR